LRRKREGFGHGGVEKLKKRSCGGSLEKELVKWKEGTKKNPLKFSVLEESVHDHLRWMKGRRRTRRTDGAFQKIKSGKGQHVGCWGGGRTRTGKTPLIVPLDK